MIYVIKSSPFVYHIFFKSSQQSFSSSSSVNSFSSVYHSEGFCLSAFAMWEAVKVKAKKGSKHKGRKKVINSL